VNVDLIKEKKQKLDLDEDEEDLAEVSKPTLRNVSLKLKSGKVRNPLPFLPLPCFFP
jgi:hypothetical protein